MEIDIITLFPEMCKAVMEESIIGRAVKKGILKVDCHQLRDYTYDKHNRVDDTVYGGGKGMLLLAEPLADCFEHICEIRKSKPHLIYASPGGKILSQKKIKELSKLNNIAIVCGHYEGIDQRFIDEFVDEEISIGDYVLTGGELPALVILDSICRMVKGVLADDECFEKESHFHVLLEHPQYTKPSIWRGHEVPFVLRNGNHALIEEYNKRESLIKTKKVRPDLIKKLSLTEDDKEVIKNI
jgi:tRNA (guanine37-N1)-methyltransferase